MTIWLNAPSAQRCCVHCKEPLYVKGTTVMVCTCEKARAEAALERQRIENWRNQRNSVMATRSKRASRLNKGDM